MNPTKILMAAALALAIISIVYVLIKRDRSSLSQINLEDLLLGDDGKLSKAAAVMMGAFAMTTWLMVYLALGGKMTEGYLAIYVGAWIAPTVARLIVGPKAETTTNTSTVTSTTVKPTGE